MKTLLGILIVLYIVVSLAIFFRVSFADSKLKGTLWASFIAPIYSVSFLVWCVLSSLRGLIDKNAPSVALRHLDDVMFIFVVMWATMSQQDRQRRKQNNDRNQDIYKDIRASYC